MAKNGDSQVAIDIEKNDIYALEALIAARAMATGLNIAKPLISNAEWSDVLSAPQ
ncbi:MAG: hypothetical protein ACOYEP_07120 [Limnochordia bacterium]